MHEPTTISRASVKGDKDAFAALKAQGVKLAQQISGEKWSDYNAHDPGVTILEQLCYALSELTFHSDFDVADLLQNDDGYLDYRAQSLHRPEEVFSSRATTVTDLRKVLLNEVKEIDNVWLSMSAHPSILNEKNTTGIYHAAVRRDHDCDIDDKTLITRVMAAFHRNRNLCEDLGSVVILQDKGCALYAEVEVDGNRHADELIAEIYFKCGDYISGNTPLSSYSSALNEKGSLEALFDGPLTHHGVFGLVEDESDEIIVPVILSIINAIEGVDNVKNLHLEVGGEKIYEALPRLGESHVITLDYPENAADMAVKLYCNGNLLPFKFDAVRKRNQEMNFRRDSMRKVEQDFSSLYSLPEGGFHGVENYASIQQQFPVIYGVNQYGKSSESVEEVARTQQLKAYLLLFDQVMANFRATTGQLNKLYSTDNKSHQSYEYELIDAETVAGIELIYPENPAQVISKILARYDRYFDRKGRVLDYLLALYGQEFTQSALRHFNYYYHGIELDEVMVENKITALEMIIKFDRDRGAGYNVLAPSWNTDNVSGLQRKLSVLLGFKHIETRSLTLPFSKLGLKVVSHDTYRAMKHGSHELKVLSLSDIQEHLIDEFHPVVYQCLDEALPTVAITENLEDFIPLKNNMISDALLQGGVSVEHFKVGCLSTEGGDYQVVFKLDDERDWWYVGRAEKRSAAEKNVQYLNRFIIELNIESEGVHLLEHLLLRPQQTMYFNGISDVEQREFYSSRISVIFPSWTARCNDPRFRALAEESVKINCPAHLLADVYWLDFDAMYRFETLYKCWLDARDACDFIGVKTRGQSAEDVDNAAKALFLFFNEQQCGGDE